MGCGDGSFIAALAEQTPELNFLGIERLRNRVRSARRKTGTFDNVQILHAETSAVVRHQLTAEAIEAFYLLFPDPWPKRRHHRRRLVTAEFLASISRALVPNGVIRIATDHADYFDWIVRLAVASPALTIAAEDFPTDIARSTFARRFKTSAVPIYRLELRKVSPVT